jgi:hypothetical protein
MLMADNITGGKRRKLVKNSIKIDSTEMIMAYTKTGHDFSISDK